jgi:hypothetical protein
MRGDIPVITNEEKVLDTNPVQRKRCTIFKIQVSSRNL